MGYVAITHMELEDVLPWHPRGARQRLAAEAAVSDAYHQGCKTPCKMCGDRFYPVILTNHCGWYCHSNGSMAAVAHSGDKTELFNIEADRFDHYSCT